tara:strand:+ start:1067 stop:1306 length:240 start_codon:yes stop_codon:yes gene_type:complete
MNKDKVIELLGDIAWFSGILILQNNMYNEMGTKEDSETIAVMLRNLSKEIGLTEEDIIAIETTADNKLKEQLNAKIEKV